MRADTIAVVAFNGIRPFHLAIPYEVFGEDRRDDGVPRFKLRVCAVEDGPLLTSAGYTIDTPYTLRHMAQAGIVIVPSWRDPDETPPPELLDALRRAHRRGAKLVGLCLGAFVLAAAGVLDGRPATTHWCAASAFAKRFPRVRLDRDVLYVDHGDVLTSAGTAAGIDCCLHILRQQYGAQVANTVARRMVVSPHRQGGQAQYIERPLHAFANGDRLADSLNWVRQHLAESHTLDDLAARTLLSRRTFTRRFRQTTGTTFGTWLAAQRLALAQRLLETTDHVVDHVAEQSGFGSALSLRQNFNAAMGISPVAYRRQFRGG